MLPIFWVTTTMLEQPEPDPKPQTAAPALPQAGDVRRRVLVVDDDRAVREVFRRSLLLDGYDVIVATGGAEGLQLLGSDPNIGLVLLDLDMPHIDGRRFREVQRSDTRLAAVPTVIITGTSVSAALRDELQVLEYVSKPVNRTGLLAVVGRYIVRE
jgi:CheY-like chemotaxis protein